MTVTARNMEGDTRERIIHVGWFGKTFKKNGRTFHVRNEEVWVKGAIRGQH